MKLADGEFYCKDLSSRLDKRKVLIIWQIAGVFQLYLPNLAMSLSCHLQTSHRLHTRNCLKLKLYHPVDVDEPLC